jgi:hypothetical protein
MQGVKKSAPKKKSIEDRINEQAVALRAVIDKHLDEAPGVPFMNKPNKVKLVQAACELVVEGINMLSRDELVEQMADQIEDAISEAISQARSSADSEGDVDDSMEREAVDDALDRVRSNYC